MHEACGENQEVCPIYPGGEGAEGAGRAVVGERLQMQRVGITLHQSRIDRLVAAVLGQEPNFRRAVVEQVIVDFSLTRLELQDVADHAHRDVVNLRPWLLLAWANGRGNGNELAAAVFRILDADKDMIA